MKRVSVLLSESDAERFDHYCRETGHKKSTLIARLIKEHLAKQQFAVQGNILDRNQEQDAPSN